MSLVGYGTWRGLRDDEVALRDEGEALTWAELDELLNRSVNALLDRDVGSERRIAVFAENSVTTVVCYLAGVLAGCSGVPVNYHLRAQECAYILTDSRASLLFVGPENLEVGIEAAKLAGNIPVIAWGTAEAAGIERWEDFVASGAPEEPPDGLRPLPYLHYTSGTTGFPKGAQTPPNLYPGGEAATIRDHIAALVQSTPRDVGPWLTMAPLYHSGQISPIKRALAGGRPLVVWKHFDPERVLWAIQEYRIGGVLMVPTHFVRLLALPEEVRGRYDVSSMRQLTHVGAACPIEVKYQIIEWFGPVVYEGYGATEQGTISSIGPEEWLEHPGSVGRVRQGLELHVVDELGNPLGPGQVGRLYFRDLSGFDISFHNDPEKTSSVHLSPGLWTVGEVGYVDQDGYLYLTDRFSDMVISGGVNIYPAEAEQALLQLDGVSDVACIGVPDEDLGELLKALVVPKDAEQPPSPERLISQTRERLSKYKCPRSVEFVSDLGRNSLGKVNKQELRDRYLRGEVPGLTLVSPAADVAAAS
jgi:long-chain acyl-CoA synthetase